jgi:hypothetical protein
VDDLPGELSEQPGLNVSTVQAKQIMSTVMGLLEQTIQDTRAAVARSLKTYSTDGLQGN